VAMASFMGTLQSQLVSFPYLRPIWSDNTREEALLGVSMTGIYGNEYLNGIKDPEKLDATLEMLKQVVINTNKHWAPIIGVNPSAATTCVKPEGTVSQLTLTESGIHPGHAPFYIRRIRQDKKDPLTKFLMEQGIPYADDPYNPDETVVFDFVQRSKGIVRKDVTAIDHLKMWLKYQRHWCEHKPSVTITVKPHEWDEVGDWVYEHFDEVTGVSFMPYDGGTYKLAPYEDCTEEEYNRRLALLPKFIDWDSFKEYSDNVVGAQTLACTANGCSI
jgi:ribonucleoside-triphosphate reductase